jgi:hypothetical protein
MSRSGALTCELMASDVRGAVVQVLSVIWREDERALPSPQLEEQILVEVKVEAILHEGAAHPHVGERKVRGRQRRRQAEMLEERREGQQVELGKRRMIF